MQEAEADIVLLGSDPWKERLQEAIRKATQERNEQEAILHKERDRLLALKASRPDKRVVEVLVRLADFQEVRDTFGGSKDIQITTPRNADSYLLEWNMPEMKDAASVILWAQPQAMCDQRFLIVFLSAPGLDNNRITATVTAFQTEIEEEKGSYGQGEPRCKVTPMESPVVITADETEFSDEVGKIVLDIVARNLLRVLRPWVKPAL